MRTRKNKKLASASEQDIVAIAFTENREPFIVASTKSVKVILVDLTDERSKLNRPFVALESRASVGKVEVTEAINDCAAHVLQGNAAAIKQLNEILYA